MKKADREKVFNKFGGRCAYCGCDLVKGWHVDEVAPVRRNYKRTEPVWKHKTTKDVIPAHRCRLTEADLKDYVFVDSRLVADGCLHPENFNIDNQMPACASCNINKHSGTVEDFRKLIAGFMNHLNNVSTQYKIAKRYGLVQETIKPVVFYFERVSNTPDRSDSFIGLTADERTTSG